MTAQAAPVACNGSVCDVEVSVAGSKASIQQAHDNRMSDGK